LLHNNRRRLEPEEPPQFAVDLLNREISDWNGLSRARQSPSKDGRLSTPYGAPPPAVETLDSPFQSEKGLFQEIDGEWRRPGRARLPLLCSAIAMENS
jgi:hypothetical protein